MSTLSYMYVSKEIPMLHSKLDDMSQNEAVLRYLQIVARLPDYGVHFFQVGKCLNLIILHKILTQDYENWAKLVGFR